MTSKKLNGYLDHLRENLETLDEQIVNARKMSKKKGKDSNALQWAKTLRDLVELRNTTLANIKAHLLGRDETGATNEPNDVYAGNPQVEYERYFRSLLSPWSQQDLKLRCEDCGKESEEVSTRRVPHKYEADEYFALCGRCYQKRTAKHTDKSEESSETSDASSILEFAETEGEGNVNSVTSETLTDVVRTTISAVALDAHSPLEKVKMLEDFKAHLVRTAYTHGSSDNIEPGIALIDKEIERLQVEAGKGQDAAGKPAT